MKRYIDTILIDWKEKKTRKPLVIRGARQVGKTYSIEYLGKQQFDNFVKVVRARCSSRQTVTESAGNDYVIFVSRSIYSDLAVG